VKIETAVNDVADGEAGTTGVTPLGDDRPVPVHGELAGHG
jgi:hypothetical protein